MIRMIGRHEVEELVCEHMLPIVTRTCIYLDDGVILFRCLLPKKLFLCCEWYVGSFVLIALSTLWLLHTYIVMLQLV